MPMCFISPRESIRLDYSLDAGVQACLEYLPRITKLVVELYLNNLYLDVEFCVGSRLSNYLTPYNCSSESSTWTMTSA